MTLTSWGPGAAPCGLAIVTDTGQALLRDRSVVVDVHEHVFAARVAAAQPEGTGSARLSPAYLTWSPASARRSLGPARARPAHEPLARPATVVALPSRLAASRRPVG